jgi:hypothetical protein
MPHDRNECAHKRPPLNLHPGQGTSETISVVLLEDLLTIRAVVNSTAFSFALR